MAGWNDENGKWKVESGEGDVPRWVQFVLGILAFVVGGLIAIGW